VALGPTSSNRIRGHRHKEASRSRIGPVCTSVDSFRRVSGSLMVDYGAAFPSTCVSMGSPRRAASSSRSSLDTAERRPDPSVVRGHGTWLSANNHHQRARLGSDPDRRACAPSHCPECRAGLSMVTGHQQPDPRAGRPGRGSNPVSPRSHRCHPVVSGAQSSRPRALPRNGRQGSAWR
jgi:hypothetical protein